MSALFCFLTWLKVFLKDTELSPQERRASWRVLIVATIFWPLVLPIAYLEKRAKRIIQSENIFISFDEIEMELNDQLARSSIQKALVGKDGYKTPD
ncbi:MAG TPA: hypothetical protein DDZ80_22250 [Cyanobacteria bacterium UBA8803]|nr:hypothetical protein [Cyanobacteria bacterium UBA9273]HBL61050.1 hypothetical protein [Cyanobacteria bacterium UBA8803]